MASGTSKPVTTEYNSTKNHVHMNVQSGPPQGSEWLMSYVICWTIFTIKLYAMLKYFIVSDIDGSKFNASLYSGSLMDVF